MRLLKNPWIDTFNDLSSSAKSSIKIAAPYVKAGVVSRLLDVKLKSVNLSLITSFKLQNYYRGASDLNALSSIIDTGGTVSNYQKLHAKTYVFDEKFAIVTSANLTNNGLIHNYEYGVLIDEPVLINQIINDYEALLKDEITGEITTFKINQAKEILSKIPPAERVHIPNIESETTTNTTDIYTGGINTITTSLKGWQLAVFECLMQIKATQFTIVDINRFVPVLEDRFPNNNHIEAKIRQQLQLLRDNGLIEFLGGGNYKKLWQ
ncbi:phospholipase D-like domain-containing protein [Mucilaginibacter sp.]